MNAISFPVITHLAPVIFKSNLKQNTLSFKGQLESDSFEKSSKTPKLKRGQLTNEKGEIFTRPDTDMFRTDMNWQNFGRYLKNRFLYEDKVNTTVYACSTGEEAYTLSILLQDILKYNAEKFFPVSAKDINEDLIKKNISNQNGNKIMKDSYLPARYALDLDNIEIQNYVTIENSPNSSYEIEKLTDKVTEPVQFSAANILEDVENIDTDIPSVIMCRNMWPYVDSSEYEEFATKLYNKLKKGSVVVIGKYDHKGEQGRDNSDTFPKALLNAGFTPADIKMSFFKEDVPLIFEKN